LMKILIHGINFHPEPTGIGKYSGEMAADWAARGHKVRAITAPPYYPAWKVMDAWANAYSQQTWNGVLVLRAPLWVPQKPSGTKRVLHLLTFSLAAVPLLMKQLIWRPDVVMVVVPAIACAPWALLLARLTGARAWLHVQDFEIDAAFRLGMLNSRGARRGLLTALERWFLRRFDRVSTISEAMLAHAAAKGVERSRLVSLPNWVDETAIKPLQVPSSYRAELDIAPEAVVVLFSGTMGGKQGLELLPAAAKQLAHRSDIVFVICGDGVMKPVIEQATQGMTNVRLLPLQPAARLNELLGLADIHVLTQHPGAADLVMPSKLSGMLASGRPVLTTAEAGTELAKVVQQCGRVVPPGGLLKFCEALCELADQPVLRSTMGRAARLLAEESFGKAAVLTRFNGALHAVVARASAGVDPVAKSTQT
jgi:colanic acid biosynthesis glycosyl transferase WcaI